MFEVKRSVTQTTLESEQQVVRQFCMVSQLRPSECVNEGRVESLARKIASDGKWLHPLLVEADNLVVMDGHHRLAASKLLGLSYLPCILLSYQHPLLTVTSWADSRPFDPTKIVEAGISGNLLSFKSTKHHLATSIDADPVLLTQLKTPQCSNFARPSYASNN